MAEKIDWTPVFGPGLHEIALGDLEKVFVEPFSDQSRRRELCNGLKRFLSALALLPLSCECWIGGSFVTQKPSPADVDVVLFFDRQGVNNLDDASYSALMNLCDRSVALARYFCDLYYDPTDEPERADYWRQKFGVASDGVTQKGIALVKINHGSNRAA